MIKIDRSLISNIDNDKKKQNRLLDLVNDMHDKVIVVLAEGIETKEEYDFCIMQELIFSRILFGTA